MPEGPAAVNLGKDLRIALISRPLGMLTGTSNDLGCIMIYIWVCFRENEKWLYTCVTHTPEIGK